MLQADGGKPEWFEIPDDLVLEININHPKYAYLIVYETGFLL